MKNNSKKIKLYLLLALVLVSSWSMAQIDDERMSRDIRVASSVLQTLSQGDDSFMMYGENVTGEYIEGYGVMFSVGGAYSFVSPRRGKAYGMRSGSSTVIFEEKGSSGSVVVAPAAPPSGSGQNSGQSEKGFEDLKEMMTTFLVDYSQLIGQLNPEDKIVISTKKSDYFYYIKTNDDNESEVNKTSGAQGLTAELSKKDHESYLSGKLKRDQVIEKINFIEHNGDNSSSKDLDLFANMLKTLYNPEYTETYFVSWTPEYEIIQGVGAVFTFRVYSSYDESGLYRLPGVDESGVTEAERNEMVKSMYPDFIESFKQNLIQYGRAINSLSNDEMIMFRVTMTKCDDCNLPKKLQFTVKQSVLKDYNTGKLKLEDAIEKVKFSEL